MRRRALLASIVAVAACASAWTRTAAAQPKGVGVEIDLRDYWLRSMPRMHLTSPLVTPLRTVDGSLPSTGEQHFLAFTVDTSYLVDRTWEIPLIGMMGGGAIGASARTVTSLDGSLVTMRPWTSGVLSVLLPGVGVRLVERRWKLGFNVRPVVSMSWMNVTVANGAHWIDASDQKDGNPLIAATLGVRAELDVCRRVDPVLRACLLVAPNLYEWAKTLNGGSIGLRLELGP